MVISGINVEDAKAAFAKLSELGVTASELQVIMRTRLGPMLTFWDVVMADELERREQLWKWNRGARRGRAAYPVDAALRTDARAHRPRGAGRMARAWRRVTRAFTLALAIEPKPPRVLRPVGSEDDE